MVTAFLVFYSIILLIIVRIINTLRKHFSVINLSGECRQYQSLDERAISYTLTHG